MKQTAVEWLEEKLSKYCILTISVKADLKQAKEIEKKQIIDFGYDIAEDLAWGKYRDKKAMEERYNEYLTFK
jgi:hypothetical protein